MTAYNICHRTDTTYVNSLKLDREECNWGPVSVPRDQAYHPTDTQPLQGLQLTRDFIKWLVPEFADAEIVSSR